MACCNATAGVTPRQPVRKADLREKHSTVHHATANAEVAEVQAPQVRAVWRRTDRRGGDRRGLLPVGGGGATSAWSVDAHHAGAAVRNG